MLSFSLNSLQQRTSARPHGIRDSLLLFGRFSSTSLLPIRPYDSTSPNTRTFARRQVKTSYLHTLYLSNLAWTFTWSWWIHSIHLYSQPLIFILRSSSTVRESLSSNASISAKSSLVYSLSTTMYNKSDVFQYRSLPEEAVRLIQRAEQQGHTISFRPKEGDSDDDDYTFGSAQTASRYRNYFNRVAAGLGGMAGLFLAPIIL